VEHCAGILVRRIRWSESSLIVTWVTDRFGAIQTSARGALRRGSAFEGRLDLFLYAEISFTLSSKSTLHSLREVQVLQPLQFQSRSYASLALASYFVELAGLVAPPMVPAPELTDLLMRALNYAANEKPTVRGLVHFERETARILGVFDESAAVPPHHALEQLSGKLPGTRQIALRALQGE